MNPYSIEKVPSDILEETAQKARSIRKRKGWSQAELAERSGVSLGSLKRFEQRGHISFLSLLKLAHVLGRLSDFEPLFAVSEDLDKVKALFSSGSTKH
ncbi:MAG: helix-turn-helix transcriptional regulator [Bacteroidota bacterium]